MLVGELAIHGAATLDELTTRGTRLFGSELTRDEVELAGELARRAGFVEVTQPVGPLDGTRRPPELHLTDRGRTEAQRVVFRVVAGVPLMSLASLTKLPKSTRAAIGVAGALITAAGIKAADIAPHERKVYGIGVLMLFGAITALSISGLLGTVYSLRRVREQRAVAREWTESGRDVDVPPWPLALFGNAGMWVFGIAFVAAAMVAGGG